MRPEPQLQPITNAPSAEEPAPTSARTMDAAVDVALHDGEARFRALFDQAAVGMVEFDIEGRILRTNDTYCRIVGRSVAEVIGQTSDGYTHPADLALAKQYIQELDSRQSMRAVFEKRYLRPDGAAVWARATLSPLFDEAGRLGRLLGIVEDISEQKNAEDRLRFLMQLSDMARPLNDPDEITAVSARLLGEHLEVDRCAYAEVAADEDTVYLAGNYTRGVKSLVGELKFSAFGSEVLALMRANRPYVVYDIDSHQPMVNLDVYRQTDTQAIICVPLHKGGKFVAALAVHQNTPRIWTTDEVQLVQAVATRCWESIERARMARHLRESEQRYRTLVDNISSVVWLTDPTGAIVADNPSWTSFTGQTWEECRGFGWLTAIHPDDRQTTFDLWNAAVRSKHNYEAAYRLRRHDGEYRWVVARGAPVVTPDGEIKEWVGNCTDNHIERMLFEQNQVVLVRERAAREEAERTGRMKDEFLATLSHELRTPLSAILGWSQLLQRANLSGEEAREGLTTIERNARVQAQLIGDLLDMSRIISGKIRLDIQQVNLPVVVAAAIATVKHSAAAKKIEVRSEFDPQMRPILGDPSRIQQVVWNLLSNSIKFTPSQGSVEVTLRRNENQAEIKVRDTGAGIAPEFLPHVFERFRQADASTTRHHGGLGLGLAIVKQLVELHGGAIHVHSDGVGQGTCFTILLPLSSSLSTEEIKPDEAKIARHKPLAETADDWQPPDLRGVCVLVVDDEPDARELARRILLECQAEVLVAKNGREAQHMLDISPPDILVSDIGMPEIDGYDLIRRARGRGFTAPAVAITAFARSEDRKRAFEAGFQEHLTKPIEARELMKTVARLLGKD